RGHARLVPLGPNDGGGILLADLLDLPGEVFPVRAADHYLAPKTWDIRPLLRRILRASVAKPASPRPPVGDQRERDTADDVQNVMLLGRQRRVEDQCGPNDAD